MAINIGTFPWRGWRGFSIDPRDSRLYTPNGYTLTPGDLEHFSMVAEERRQLYKERGELKDRVTELESEVLRLRQQLAEQIRPASCPVHVVH